MTTRALFGGTPGVALRVANGCIAAAGITIGVWALFADDQYTPGNWFTTASHVSAVLVGLVAAAQAAAPVRFLWPGWILVFSLVVPLGGSSVLSIGTYFDMPGGLVFPAHVVIQFAVLPLALWASVAAALVAWQLQPEGQPAEESIAPQATPAGQ